MMRMGYHRKMELWCNNGGDVFEVGCLYELKIADVGEEWSMRGGVER